MSRADALAVYERLPIPDTTEEHWRFTNLRGFDPETFAGAASAEIETLLDLDVAGYATVTADGIEIEKAPEGITFAPLPEEHERLYSLVGWDEKFAAHNAAMWRHGLLVEVPRGVVHTFWNRSEATARAKWQVRPAQRTEDFFKAVHDLRAAGHGTRAGLSLPAGALAAHEFSAEFTPALPQVARSLFLPALAAWAKRRGYRV